MRNTQVFLAPCSNSDSRANFERTVLNKVSRETYTTSTNRDLGETIAIWGISEGNRGTWRKIKENDILLFYTGDWKYEYAARVQGREENQGLATKLWPGQDKFTAWSLIVYLNEITEVEIDSHEIHEYASYQRMFPYRFIRLREEGIETIRNQYGSLSKYIDEKGESIR